MQGASPLLTMSQIAVASIRCSPITGARAPSIIMMLVLVVDNDLDRSTFAQLGGAMPVL